jgi:hypothetical protein
MNAPNFGTICSDPQDGVLANSLSLRLAKIEEAMTGASLKHTLDCCEVKTEFLTPEEKRKKEEKEDAIAANLYPTHNSHLLQLIIVIVDDLGLLTVAIDRVQMIDVKLYLREWYYQLKDELCKNPDAMAYRLSK